MEHSKLPWKFKFNHLGVKNMESGSVWTDNMDCVIAAGADIKDAMFIVEACNNYERLQAENKAWETNYTNLQAEYEEMASIAYSKTEELERLKNRIEDMKARYGA